MKKKNWIKDAIKKPGALRESLGVKEGKTIPAKKLEKAAKAPGKLGQRARLAQTLKKMNAAEGGMVDTSKMTKKQTAKVGKVMGEFKDKSLHSGKGGPVVKNRKQAVAIALSEASKLKKK